MGQNLGAGRPDRAEQAVWRASFYNLIFLGSIGVLFFVFANVIVRAFNTDPVVVGYGTNALRIISAGFLFYAYGMVVSQSFNGAGDTWTPTFINLFCFWLWQLPLAYALAHVFGYGPRGVVAAITIAWSTYAVVSATIFKRGRWKLKKV